jgi:hypothetical protein
LSAKEPASLRVEGITPPGGSHGDGVQWFKVGFPSREGRCYIATEEAQHLRQLSAERVERALRNLAEVRGWDWLESRACSTRGLLLHRSDAG